MKKRVSKYPVLDIILNRWSARAMSGESIDDTQLMTLFEAAHWAPSSYNNQPWRFLYAKRDTKHWDTFFNLLVPFNQSWAKNAAVLIVIISHNLFEYNDKTSRTHSFDTGAAWENLALQGSADELVVHGMEGFDYNRARTELAIPDEYTIEAMAAVGKPASAQTLPPDLQKKEEFSDRKPVEDIIFEGKFSEK